MTAPYDAAASAAPWNKKLEELQGGEGLRSFICHAFPSFNWYKYNEVIVQDLQDLIDGKLILPDGEIANKYFAHLVQQSGKSTLIQLFCAYAMTRYPGIILGVAMHNLRLARRFSRNVRAFYRNAGGTLATSGIENWTCDGPTTAERSEFWVVSVGSHPAGLPADGIIGDDLNPDEETAHHPGRFKDQRSWLAGQFIARKRKHGHPSLGRFFQILINTRQALCDVASFWLLQGGFFARVLPTLYDPETWPIGLPVGPFPAVGGTNLLPETTIEAPNCTIAKDWREVGEGLEEGLDEKGNPLIEDLTAKAFHARRLINGGILFESTVSSNEQGCPKLPAGGGIFHRDWTPYRPWESAWVFTVLARAWDWASTEGGGDWTASVLMGRLDIGLDAVLHACRGRKDATGVVQLMAAMAILDGPSVIVALPQGQGEGKLTFAGMKTSVTEILRSVGAPTPPFRAMPVRTSTHSGAYRSAKEQRFAQPGGFAPAAQPADWDWGKKTSTSPGNIVLCEDYKVWDEARAKWLSGPVFQLARAACGHLNSRECEALNICPGPGLWVMREELHGFGGHDGGSDHYVDAAADAKMALSRGGGWGISSYD